MARRPIENGGEPHAPIEVAPVASTVVPVLRRPDQVLVQAAPLGVLLEPATQSWPFAQQSFVRDLRRPFADGDEAPRGEGVEHPPRPLVGLEIELVEGCLAAYEQVAVTSRKPQEDRARRRLPTRVEAFESSLGEPGHGASDTAALSVRGRGQGRPIAHFPELQQRGREQRQRSRLFEDVGDQGMGQRRLDEEARPLRRELDRAAQLARLHRADEHLVLGKECRQARVVGEPAVEVGANREHDHRVPAGLCGEPVEKRSPLRLVAAVREDLLELVDREHEPPVRDSGRKSPVQLLKRTLPGANHGLGPGLAVRECARRQSREQPCPKKGGLPTSRGAEDAERRSARETGNQLGDHTLAAEEETGVAGVEGREPFERADPAICLRRRLSLTVDGLKAGNVLGELGLGRPQLAPAHRRPLSRLLDEGRSRRVDERTAGRKPVVGPLREGSAHHGIKAGEADQRRSVLVCMGEEHGSPSCPLEGGMPGQALVEHTAEGVEIGATIDGLTRHLLGGGVRDGAGEVRPVIPPVLVGSAGEAEV